MDTEQLPQEGQEEITEQVIEPTQEEIEQPEVEQAETFDEEVEEPEVEVEEEPAEEAEQTEERQPSRRESLRIQQLIQRMKDQPKTANNQVPEALDYSQALDADEEVINRLEQDRTQYGQNLQNQALDQLKSVQFHTRLEIDAPRVESKYPQLDKSSTEFNPAVADAVNNWYLATAGYDSQTDTVKNSDVRYADFVEGIMEMADEIAGEKNSRTVKNVAKQAAVTGLRPDGSKAKKLNLNQSPENMTDEELKAYIDRAFPN
jgi:hypothetical protein